MRILASLSAGVVLAACSGSSTPTPPDDPPVDTTVVYLTPTQHLTRASLALRGLRPSIDDLRAVDADPAKLPSIIDGYLSSPELGETIRELHNETLLLRVEQGNLTFPAIGGLTGATATRINGAVFDEPLRLIEDIVMSDQPYTKVVTADYTMADGAVAEIWGLPHAGTYDAWERTQWTDGRGAAGVLATSVLYHRHRSTGFNYNRGRANLISSAFLCHDFLDSDIQVDTSVDLSDPDVVADAVVANKSCAGCHQTMDPLASYLFPFRGQIGVNNITSYPLPYFLPGQVNRWQTTNKRPPMYFGQPATGLAGLGRVIADDPRFARCTAQRFASYLTEVAPASLSGAWIARLQREFVDGNFSAKQLAKAIVLSDEFRVSHDTDVAAAEGLVGTLKLRPEQLSRMLRGLTGLGWTTTSAAKLRGIPYGTADLLQSDFIGFRVLAGGIDSYFVTEPVHTMNATSSLVAKAAAAAAADFVVAHDVAAPAAQRTLFVQAAPTATDEPAVRAELAYLHGRIYGELVLPDSPEVDQTYQLFTEALAAAPNAQRAWRVTLIGMLSDFRSLFY
ncbi:MAG TPA: hypothetical protein VN253_21430 [Kofleriaceae bacterium]|nr:hypothetical protein [Kofleriaceae bacterium]